MRVIFDVITVGSNVVDVFVKTNPEESELITISHGSRSKREELVAYPLGTKIIIDKIDFQVGGGGTNTATAFSRLGLVTGYVGKIGRDDNGLRIFSFLKKEGITFLGSLGDVSGYSVILDSVGDDRTILTFKGCNNDLRFSELDKKRLRAKAFYCSSMVGSSFDSLSKILSFAKKQGSLTAFNPSSYLTEKGLKFLRPLLRYVDVLVLNREEASDLLGSLSDEDLLKGLFLEGPDTVVITKGSEGVVAYHDGFVYSARPVSGLRVVETTGAGDAFGSTLFAGLIMNKSFKDSLRMAMINAESVISHYGAKNLLLTRSALERKLSRDKRRVSAVKVNWSREKKVNKNKSKSNDKVSKRVNKSSKKSKKSVVNKNSRVSRK